MTVAEEAKYASEIQRLHEANQALEKRNSEVSNLNILGTTIMLLPLLARYLGVHSVILPSGR